MAVVVSGLKHTAPSCVSPDLTQGVPAFVAFMDVLADVRAEAAALERQLFHGLNLPWAGFEMAVHVDSVVVELHVECVGCHGVARNAVVCAALAVRFKDQRLAHTLEMWRCM
jgi:hypothetical protein